MQYPTKQAIHIAAFALLAAMSPALGCDSESSGAVDGSAPSLVEPNANIPQASDAHREDVAEAPSPITAAEADSQVAPKLVADARGPKLGTFEFTYYWMASETKQGTRSVPLYMRKTCRKLAVVSPGFARKLNLEGTGKLRDGRVVNTAGSCDCPRSPCFFKVSKRMKWGVGVGKKPLSPFRTVAVDPKTVRIGTTLYIPELDGMTMPGKAPWGGFVHDGCVLAGDRGGGVRGKQLDFFTAKRHHYKALFGRHRIESVTVFDGKGRCEKKGRSVVAAHRNAI